MQLRWYTGQRSGSAWSRAIATVVLAAAAAETAEVVVGVVAVVVVVVGGGGGGVSGGDDSIPCPYSKVRSGKVGSDY